ncbi:GNAT family N-acetyltransferase [Devosia sp. 1566]|uniref:GNAT family N-acetyltransferase n=1 Tax=Devosia sp. 1566 TaxID=2499144 RepID=UPI000FD7D7BA|nr:GNAT family N-acetyltransferase [Devosia sp. 1566]
MNTTHNHSFRAVMPDDLAMLASWQANPHVREWWDREPYNEADLADLRVSRWIVLNGDRPFAYMQDYSVHAWEDHPFSYLPRGARGIDQFIGDPEMLGMGHGSAFISLRMRTLFAEGVPVIATDPHPDNLRAIAAYKKVGFEAVGAAQETQWGLVLPMLAKPV